MPLSWASGEHGRDKAGRRRVRWKRSRRMTDEDDTLPSLTQLCLFSITDNMKEVWMKSNADKYLDQYSFRQIVGPFNLLPGELVEELTCLLSNRKQLSRAVLHLLLVPQLHNLSLERCPGLVTSALCTHIAARCQGLWSLDVSGAQQLPSKVLSETLCCLPALRSLSLAGTPCDRRVIKTITHHCPLLRHLDVSRCHFLSPASLLALVGGAFCSSSSGSSFCSTSTSQPPVASSSGASPSPLPLTSLLALDIGFGEQEGDPVAAAAYLLLSLPGLKTVAMEGVAQACRLIEHREFSQTDEFSIREGVPRLMEVWSERRHGQHKDSWMEKREGAAAAAATGEEEHEEKEMLWEAYCEESDEDLSGDEGPSCSGNQLEEKSKGGVLSQSDASDASDEKLILQLKVVKGVICDFLDSLGHLCPHICSISVSINYNTDTTGRNWGSMLATGLQTWSGQLQSLSLLYPGPLKDLSPALQMTGSSLVSLSLEGVKTSPHSPLLEVIKACPRLRELLIFADPPSEPLAVPQEDVVAQWVSLGRPQLPNLCSLTINFTLYRSQMMPVMSWLSLRKVLKCLLIGSPLLERLSLVSLPCPLNCLLEDLLGVDNFHMSDLVWFADLSVYANLPLRHVQHIDLTWTDVKTIMVETLLRHCRRLKFVDVSHCWEIGLDDLVKSKTLSDVKVVWVK